MKPAFSLPNRKVDDWVNRGGEAAEAPAPKVKPARLTIDLHPELHAKFKSACALRGTNMVDEVRSFIENWVG